MNKVTSSTLTGNRVIFEAWEPATAMGLHDTVIFMDGQMYGRIGTRTNLPASIRALPFGGLTRIRATEEWYDEQYAEAYKLINADDALAALTSRLLQIRHSEGRIEVSVVPAR